MAKKVKQVQEIDMAKQYNLKGPAPEKRMSMWNKKNLVADVGYVTPPHQNILDNEDKKRPISWCFLHANYNFFQACHILMLLVSSNSSTSIIVV